MSLGKPHNFSGVYLQRSKEGKLFWKTNQLVHCFVRIRLDYFGFVSKQQQKIVWVYMAEIKMQISRERRTSKKERPTDDWCHVFLGKKLFMLSSFRIFIICLSDNLLHTWFCFLNISLRSFWAVRLELVNRAKFCIRPISRVFRLW